MRKKEREREIEREREKERERGKNEKKEKRERQSCRMHIDLKYVTVNALENERRAMKILVREKKK